MLSEIFVFLISFVICWIEFNKWYLRRTKLKNFFELKGLPLIGRGYEFIGKDNGDLLKVFDNIFSQHDQVNKLKYSWAGMLLIALIDDPDDLQLVLNSDKCLEKPIFFKYFRNETGLFASKPHIWKSDRRALNQTLNLKMVTSFVPIFNEKFKVTADKLERHVGHNVDLHKLIFKASAEGILATQCNIDWPMQTQRGDEIYDLLDELFDCIQYRLVRVWLRYDFLYNLTSTYQREMTVRSQLMQFIHSAYEFKRVELADRMDRGEDVLTNKKESNKLNFLEKCLFLQREGKFNVTNVWDQLETIFIGATDTTSTVITSTLLMLAIHQEYQDRVVAELHEICANVDDYITSEDVTKMTYVEMVIKESLRLYAVAPIFGRQCNEDLEIRGGILPKGTHLWFNAFKLHRNPKHWGDNAHLFYPERFLPQNAANLHPYAFLGFSHGPRNCIGIKYSWTGSKILLAYLLRRFKFTTDLKYEDVRLKPALMLKIQNEKPVRVEHREW